MLNSAAQQDAAKYGRFHIFPAESVALVNSLMGSVIGVHRHPSIMLTYSYQRHNRAQAVDFGFPGKSQYYTEVSWERMFRVFPTNPVRRHDGTWDSNEGSVVVSFRVKNELHDKIISMFQEDMHRLEEGLEVDN